MIDFISVLIWLIIIFIGVGGLLSLRDNKAMLKFVIWFGGSLIGVMLILFLLGSDIESAILIAVIMAMLGSKDA